MVDSSEVLFELCTRKKAGIGLITLNRPAVLNALNHEMFLAIDAHLAAWEKDSRVNAVLIQAVPGRAFSAGGDIRAAYEKGKAKDPHLNDFFRDEYRLDKRIFHYPKPYIALLDGITMGGGAGISIHGSHRVATPKMSFAMPETGIGFFPDIGATYFLPRLPGKFGMYLALTGARISAEDAKALGLVDVLVESEFLSDIRQALMDEDWQADPQKMIRDILFQFRLTAAESALMQHEAEVNYCFGKNSVEDILDALEHYPSPWCEEVFAQLSVKSPTSLKLTFELMRQGVSLDFDACIAKEFEMATHLLQEHDFYEGVRAVLIDKDQKPEWSPKHLSEVSLEKFFA